MGWPGKAKIVTLLSHLRRGVVGLSAPRPVARDGSKGRHQCRKYRAMPRERLPLHSGI